MNTQPYTLQFLEKPFRTFFLLWTPVLFSMVAEPLTGLVDTAFVSRLGTEALAALGVGTVILTGGLWLFNFLGVGTQTEISQATGAKNIPRARRIGSLALLLALTSGAILGVLIYLCAPLLASLMGATGDIQDYSVTYIRIRALGSPAVLMTMASFGILYGLADMRAPLIIAIAVNSINIVLDYILIFGIGPVPPFGIAGAASATAASQWLGIILCAIAIRRKLGFSRTIQTADIKKLLTIGNDMIIRTGSLILFLLLATRTATQLGPDSGAAHQAIRQAWVFTALFLDASAVTAQSLIGNFFGSNQIRRARAVSLLVCKWSLLIGVLLTAAMLAGTNVCALLLVPETGRALFFSAWTVSSLFQPIAALAFVTDGIHWGTGDFRFLRNVVVLSTVCGGAALLTLEAFDQASLLLIWWITGFWVLIRAVLGIIRIWPGSASSPLRVN